MPARTRWRAKRARPDKLRGTTIRKETPLGTMFLNITEDDRGQPFGVRECAHRFLLDEL